MKILQVTAALQQGGVERGTVEMAAFIVAQGAHSLVASQGGRLVRELEAHGTRHIQLPLARRTPWSIVYCAFKLCRLIQQEKISLVHARSRAPAWAAYLACRWTGVPFLTTFHGTHRIQNRLKKFYNSIMVRGRRVIAISEFIKAHIMTHYGVDEARIDVAPRGYDPAVFNPQRVDETRIDQLRNSLGLTGEAPVISLPGRLTRWKGQVVLLEALNQIKDLAWHVLFIGGEDKKTAYLHELQQLAMRYQIADRVHFVGDQTDIALYYQVSDLVVSASTEPEAFGRVAVEAQAMGCPVVASAHGGALETVRDGETGWLFTPGNADDLAATLRRVLTGNDDLRAVGERGRQWVAQRYTIDRMCQAEWDCYEKMLHDCREPRRN
nr:glycosyltransferase family 4 protein [uncultured Desulfuromonas sp.]